MLNAAIGVVWRQEAVKTTDYETNPFQRWAGRVADIQVIYPVGPFGRKAQIRRDGEGGDMT